MTSDQPSQPASASLTDKKEEPTKRSFIPVEKKENSFYMKAGSVVAGGVVIALIIATGVMLWTDKVAKDNVPKLPPVDAIVKVDPKPVNEIETDKQVEGVSAMAAMDAASAPMDLTMMDKPVADATATATAAMDPASTPMAVNSTDPQPGSTDNAAPVESAPDVSVVDQNNSLEELRKQVDLMQTQMQTQFEGVNKTLADLQKRVKAQAIRLRSAQGDKDGSGTEMKIVQITPNSVDVMVGIKKYTVMTGSRLPGGATFLGFDVAKSVMRTDRGDFNIK